MAGDKEGPIGLTYKQALAFRPLWEMRFQCKLKIGRIPKNLVQTGEHVDKSSRETLNNQFKALKEKAEREGMTETLRQQIEVVQVARTLEYKKNDPYFLAEAGFTDEAKKARVRLRERIRGSANPSPETN